MDDRTPHSTADGNVDAKLMEILVAGADVVTEALSGVSDWRAEGDRPTQYGMDLLADGPLVAHLVSAGLGVMSEESGRHHPDRPLCAVIDPVDGSTNASRRIPWYATSIAVVDADGVRAAVVRNQATSVTYSAIRGGGAFRDGVDIHVSSVTALAAAVVAVNGHPPRHLGWSQYRALGAAALDICLVAEGAIDGYMDCTFSSHGPWDYLGAMLVLTEAGGWIADADGRGLITIEHGDRRTPVAAGTAVLGEELLAGRRSFDV